jgi:acyl-CoA synthetase (AMP-forming)/AMP-acid ligase II
VIVARAQERAGAGGGRGERAFQVPIRTIERIETELGSSRSTASPRRRRSSPSTTGTEPELIAHCRSRLAHYKCPTSVELRDTLVRTATGKLQKFKLREPYWAGRARRVN